MSQFEDPNMRGVFGKFLAKRVTPETVDHIATWCNGSVKGVRLPANERCIDFITAEDGEETRAEIGDWVVKFADKKFTRFTDAFFKNVFLPLFEGSK